MKKNNEAMNVEKTNDKSKTTIFFITVVLIVGVIIILLLMRGCSCFNRTALQNDIDVDTSAVDWNGNQRLDGFGNGDNSDRIAIPCFDGLTFKSNQITQKVNIYNPEYNTCYMVFNLIVNDETIWQSGNVAPSKGYYEIELAHGLPCGVYGASLFIECFDRNGNPLNNGLSDFTLYVQ